MAVEKASAPKEQVMPHQKSHALNVCVFGDWPLRLARGAVARITMRVALAVVPAALSAPVAAQDKAEGLADLGTFSQAVSTVIRAANDAGMAVGSGNPAGPRSFGGRRGVVLQPGAAPTVVPGLAGSDDTTVYAVNASGTLVGASNTAVAVRAFINKRGASVQELPPLPGDKASVAYAVNKADQAVGYSSGLKERAVLWSNTGSPSQLPVPLEVQASRAYAINDDGDVVGSSTVGGIRRAVVWRSGQLATGLPTLSGYAIGEAHAINARGDSVGYSGNAAAIRRATRWSAAGIASDLGVLPGGDFSEALSINDAGEVVGASTTSDGDSRAVLWSKAGAILDLNTMVGTQPVVLTKAVGINNQGAIVVVGHDAHAPSTAAGSHAHEEEHDMPVRVFLITRHGGQK